MTAETLETGVWLLASIDGAPIAPGARLVFDGANLNGQGPCNAIRGAYDGAGDDFSVAALVSTQGTCPRQEEELRMIDGLLLAETAAVEDGRLLISSAEGPSLTFTPEG